MKIGLVGLPKSGKTSLFNLLTGQSVATSSFGTARGEMHTGVARVPDERVDRLSALFTPEKTTYASFEVVDLAGIARGERQGLEAKEFRNADALLHVVRAFPDASGNPPNPRGDIVDLETELILADLEVVERRLERLDLSLRKKRTDAELQREGITERWTTFREYFDLVNRKGISVNLMSYVAMGQLRLMVIGEEFRKPTPPEIDQMKVLARQAMEDGAQDGSTRKASASRRSD